MLRNALRSVPRRVRLVEPMSSPPRFLSTSATRMSPSILQPVIPPVSTTLPSDSFQLLSTSQKAGQAEDDLFNQQVLDVRQWWTSPRYEGIKRPYSAEDVVSKRGTLQQMYPSSIMARKLFNLLKERSAKGEPVHTSVHLCPCVLHRLNLANVGSSGSD
jgi:isocitrate lyase